MAALFYDSLVPWDQVELYLHNLDLEPEDRASAIELIEETVHTEILVTILSAIPQEKHTEFIERFHAAPHDTDHFVYIETLTEADVPELISSKASSVISKILEED